MKTKVIDFKAYRTGAMLQTVIWHFDLRGSNGDSLRKRGPCPLCSSGDLASRNLAVDLKVGVWFCHKCKCSGTALTLYGLVAQVGVYEAAKDLSKLAGLPVPWLVPVLPDDSQDSTRLLGHDTGLANRNNNVTPPSGEGNAKNHPGNRPRSRHVA